MKHFPNSTNPSDAIAHSFKVSPHCNERPKDSVISMIVIHNISLPPNEYGGGYIDDFFQGKLNTDVHPYFKTIEGMKVSSHFLINRNGEIVQFVKCGERAWHAGDSCWKGKSNCNDFSIGIELEGNDIEAYTDAQYSSLVQLSNELMRHHSNISIENIVGHNQIAPDRKTDPGDSFDWGRYRKLLTALDSE